MTNANEKRFRVGLTADFYDASGKIKYRDIGLNLLDAIPGLEVNRFADHRAEIGAEQLLGLNAAIVLSPRVTVGSLACSDDLLTIVRFGVGFDSVDVAACTEADVALFITAGAVDHSVAEATVGWMLALTHHIRIKDGLVRTGQWDARSDALYTALTTRRIAGAALDCFVGEPILAPSRWSELDNVLLAPHSIAWTDELFRDIGRCACQAIIDLSQHRLPGGLVNPDVLLRAGFQTKWTRR